MTEIKFICKNRPHRAAGRSRYFHFRSESQNPVCPDCGTSEFVTRNPWAYKLHSTLARSAKMEWKREIERLENELIVARAKIERLEADFEIVVRQRDEAMELLESYRGQVAKADEIFRGAGL